MELVKIESLTQVVSLNNFDDVIKLFKENNKGLESEWSWHDAFILKGMAFDLLWENKITHDQYNEFWDAVSVPLF